MQKAVILTESEYNALLEKANKVIDNEEIKYLKACETSLYAFTNPTRICPKCGEAMLVEGFICPSCGYDDSDYEE